MISRRNARASVQFACTRQRLPDVGAWRRRGRIKTPQHVTQDCERDRVDGQTGRAACLNSVFRICRIVQRPLPHSISCGTNSAEASTVLKDKQADAGYRWMTRYAAPRAISKHCVQPSGPRHLTTCFLKLVSEINILTRLL